MTPKTSRSQLQGVRMSIRCEAGPEEALEFPLPWLCCHLHYFLCMTQLQPWGWGMALSDGALGPGESWVTCLNQASLGNTRAKETGKGVGLLFSYIGT